MDAKYLIESKVAGRDVEEVAQEGVDTPLYNMAYQEIKHLEPATKTLTKALVNGNLKGAQNTLMFILARVDNAVDYLYGNEAKQFKVALDKAYKQLTQLKGE